jgi:hypothetical protein
MVQRWAGRGLSYSWSRTVEMGATTLDVVDRVTASREVRAEQLFHLAPLNVTLLQRGREAAAPVGGNVVHVRQQRGHAGQAFALEFLPVMGPGNRVAVSPRLSSRGVGRELVFHVTFSLC